MPRRESVGESAFENGDQVGESAFRLHSSLSAFCVAFTAVGANVESTPRESARASKLRSIVRGESFVLSWAFHKRQMFCITLPQLITSKMAATIDKFRLNPGCCFFVLL